MLLNVAIPFLKNLKEEIKNTIFIKDGAKIHQKYTKKVRQNTDIRSFYF